MHNIRLFIENYFEKYLLIVKLSFLLNNIKNVVLIGPRKERKKNRYLYVILWLHE